MIPCQECIIYAVCKQKDYIFCEKVSNYCLNENTTIKERNQKIISIRNYLGKAAAAALGGKVTFCEAYSDTGEKL